MLKLFTVEEATALIPVVSRHLSEMQTASSEARRLHEQLKGVARHSLVARNLQAEITFLLRLIQEEKAALDRLGVQLKDLTTGAVDFPSRLGNELILLHWEQGQEAITHYHKLGDPAPLQPLPS